MSDDLRETIKEDADLLLSGMHAIYEKRGGKGMAFVMTALEYAVAHMLSQMAKDDAAIAAITMKMTSGIVEKATRWRNMEEKKRNWA
jgi:hypothetical protein